MVANKLELNVQKTKYQITKTRGLNSDTEIPIKIHICHPQAQQNCTCQGIQREYEYLGVTIQDDLKWNIHCDKIK